VSFDHQLAWAGNGLATSAVQANDITWHVAADHPFDPRVAIQLRFATWIKPEVARSWLSPWTQNTA